MRGHELAMALRGAYLTMHRRTDAALAGVGVTADQFVVLSVLAEREGLTQREVVERTSSDPSTVRAMLVLMESRGLVVRRRDPADGRARRVSITRAGMRMYERAWDVTQGIRDEMVGRLGVRGTGAMIGVLGQLREAVGKIHHREPQRGTEESKQDR